MCAFRSEFFFIQCSLFCVHSTSGPCYTSVHRVASLSWLYFVISNLKTCIDMRILYNKIVRKALQKERKTHILDKLDGMYRYMVHYTKTPPAWSSIDSSDYTHSMDFNNFCIIWESGQKNYTLNWVFNILNIFIDFIMELLTESGGRWQQNDWNLEKSNLSSKWSETKHQEGIEINMNLITFESNRQFPNTIWR